MPEQIEKTKEPRSVIKLPESTLTIAQETGRFYHSLLDVYLSSGNKASKQGQTEHLLGDLPIHLQRLYKDGIEKLQKEFARNHTLIEAHRDHEVNYLLGRSMRKSGVEEEKIIEVLEKATPDKIRFIEFSPGVIFLQAEEDLYELIAREVGHKSAALTFKGREADEPSFILIQRLSGEKYLDEKGASIAEKRGLRHEFHHLIWNFLTRAGFVREAVEYHPGRNKAFAHFRSEVTAYIIEDEDLNTPDIFSLVYERRNKEIQVLADRTRVLLRTIIEVAKAKKIDHLVFLYPAMKARNFAEMRDNFISLLPLEGDVDLAVLQRLYFLWLEEKTGTDEKIVSESIIELLKRKNAGVPLEMMEMLASEIIHEEKTVWGNPYRPPVLGDLYRQSEPLGEFADSIGIKGFSREKALNTAINQKLLLPPETIAAIRETPLEMVNNIPLDKEPEAFCLAYISIWELEDEKKTEQYSQIINSSFIMRQAFDRVKEEIIQEFKKNYRSDFGYERANDERRKQVDKEVEGKIRLFNLL